MEQALFTKLAVLIFCVMVFALLLQFASEFRKILDTSRQKHSERDVQFSDELRNGLAAVTYVSYASLRGGFYG